MDFSLLKDNVVVGRVATLDPNFQAPEGFTLGPVGPSGHIWTGDGYIPPALPRAHHALLPDAFSAEECALILRKGGELVLEQATVRNQGQREHRPHARRSIVGWFRPGDPDIDPVFAKIWAIVREQNEARFNFAIERLPELQFTRYEATAAGHFDWHADVGIGEGDGFERKLSFVLMLSDPPEYQGGQFELIDAGVIDLRRGSVLVFPSTLLHRVSPVTAGVRHSLVTWVQGR